MTLGLFCFFFKTQSYVRATSEHFNKVWNINFKCITGKQQGDNAEEKVETRPNFNF